MKKLFFLVVIAAFGLPLLADVAGEARELLDADKPEEARQLLSDELDANPEAPNAGMLNQLLGEALYRQGDLSAAREYFDIAKARGVADASLWLGKLALVDYDFTGAASLYDNYIKLKKNAKKEITPDVYFAREAIDRCSEALERVECIAIIDSVTVPKEEFFTYFRLPAQSGRIIDATAAPYQCDGEVAFTNEKSDYAIWAMADSLGCLRLMESEKLIGGDWSEPKPTAEVLNNGGDADFPFMMPDGLTLYFANKGDDSLGGYDICVATRASSDDDFLEPQNLGMPYNSPFDDYMLAIDEINGVGWWASDRKQLGDSLTLFVFIPNKSRINYTEDDGNLADLARISSISATHDSITDYQSILDRIAEINPATGSPAPDFIFPLGHGRVLKYYSEIHDENTRHLMARYLEALSLYSKSEASLRTLRKDYHFKGSTSALKLRISDLEKSLDDQRREIKSLRNALYRALK